MQHVDNKDRTPLVVRWLSMYGPEGMAHEPPRGGRRGGPPPRVDPARRARGAMLGFAVVTIAAAVAAVLLG
ncbi:hypothetical protein [Streptomyces sp. SPB162]|uniref:hypothetical protein n=1 Tax=Streptomyces sp. SPB162 TaxID=2940560 RepID=UPI0024057EF1|nr:hypothetical protein [Streptomyces sp. SPB162]MDF9811141.1 hypothetical protein [Streptomyces sp. SPB162]